MSSSDGFSKEEIERITKWQFKGLDDAARLMRRRPASSKFVGRWDWHLWMFIITTCLPCFGIYCLTMWVRSSQWENHRKKEAAAKASPTQAKTELQELQEEIRQLKLMIWLNGMDSPKLSPESWRRLYEQIPVEKKTKSSPAVEETRARRSFSERLWARVTPWLPFYVEPFYPGETSGPVKSDFTTIPKTTARSDSE